MVPAVAVLKRWQSYNPATGAFDLARTNREYADVLGVHESSLSKIYAGQTPAGLKPLVGLARAFPEAAPELARAMATVPDIAGVA